MSLGYLDEFLSRPPANKADVIPPDFDPETFYARRWRFVDVDGILVRYLHYDKRPKEAGVK